MSVVKQRRGADYLIEETDPEDVLTPEDMDDEQRLMMQTIRDFAAREVEPVMDEVDARNIEVIRPLFKKAAELGIFMAEVPEEYGGLELSVLGIAGMMESRSYLGGLSSTVFAHQGIGSLPLINFGTQEQIDKYLEKLMQGDMMAAFALTEPSSGSDAMNIKTAAVLSEDGTHYVLNGSKQFITNAAWADLFILFAKVDGTQFTAFLMEGGSEGLTVLPNENLLGSKGSSVCGLVLEDVRIPVENVLGEIGKGHKVALCSLNLGRLKMATNCVGGGKKALECATQYAAERQQFGNALADFGLIQYKLAEMAARLYATQSMAYRTAGLVYKAVEEMPEETRKSIDAKLQVLGEFAVECAMSTVHGSEMVNKRADDALRGAKRAGKNRVFTIGNVDRGEGPTSIDAPAWRCVRQIRRPMRPAGEAPAEAPNLRAAVRALSPRLGGAGRGAAPSPAGRRARSPRAARFPIASASGAAAPGCCSRARRRRADTTEQPLVPDHDDPNPRHARA